MLFDTTICAPATSGRGALAIIRVSGPDAIPIGSRIISFNGKDLSSQLANTTNLGILYDGDSVLDEVMVTVYRSPHSFTGEDSIEISCHASRYIRQRTLELLMENGASLARPGEFTQRAYLNGKLDLSQAEAVADLIASESRAAHRIAIDQMRGGFSREISILREELLYFVSLIELELDFSEEDVEFADRGQLKSLVGGIVAIISRLIISFRQGNVIKNGVPVAIVGKPNVGKSTLLNQLLNEEKAIVSDIAGTTRDAIEDIVNIEGITFRFIDTAGIRESSDVIENLGITKTYQKIDQAAIILFLADATDDNKTIISSLGEIRKQLKDKEKRLILVINKTDLASKISDELRIPDGEYAVRISAKNGENIDKLREILREASNLNNLDEQGVIISNIRHYEALSKASESLTRVSNGLESGITQDFIAQDIRQALHYLGEITGEITSEDVLGNIFKNFCIGK